MAVQAGMGMSRILIMLGTGYTGTILVQNGQLSQILGSLQSYVRRLEGGSDDTDLSSQVHQITAELRQMLTLPPRVTVLNGSNGNSTTLAVQIATTGALVYGYMWWKGISFSDMAHVTKESMASAVSSLTENLEQIKSGLNATKKQLFNRLTGIEGKLDENNSSTQDIKKEVTELREDFLIPMDDKLNDIYTVVSDMDRKIDVMDSKSDIQHAGIKYLCDVLNQCRIETTKPLQAIEYRSQRKFTHNTTNGLLTIMELPEEPKQGSKVKPLISSAFSTRNTYAGISIVL